jgi:hypothetical protein
MGPEFKGPPMAIPMATEIAPNVTAVRHVAARPCGSKCKAVPPEFGGDIEIKFVKIFYFY